jgi:hypothetical protein
MAIVGGESSPAHSALGNHISHALDIRNGGRAGELRMPPAVVDGMPPAKRDRAIYLVAKLPGEGDR